MNNTISLFMKKDFIVICAVEKIYLIILAIVAVFISAISSSFSLMFLPTVTVYTLSANILVYEERFGSAILPFTLPVKLSDFVKAKYYLSTCSTLVISLFVWSVQFIYSFFIDASPAPMSALFPSIVIAFLFPSILFPLFYKLGVEKAKLFGIIIYAFVFGIMGTFSIVIDNSSLSQAADSPYPPLIIAVPILLVIYVISQILTEKIMYAKRGLA